jgi:hypothetical protein
MTKSNIVKDVKKEKVVKEKVIKDKVVNEPVVTNEESSNEVQQFPYYNGTQVVDIIQGETLTHFHCKMSDGTTMHVPKELFNK